jgi:hypothetical protein
MKGTMPKGSVTRDDLDHIKPVIIFHATGKSRRQHSAKERSPSRMLELLWNLELGAWSLELLTLTASVSPPMRDRFPPPAFSGI